MRYEEFQDTVRTTQDSLGFKSLHDTRKPVLTLKHINRLRKIRELKKFEKLKNQKLVSAMYGLKTDA